jgi:hypothetical protein
MSLFNKQSIKLFIFLVASSHFIPKAMAACLKDLGPYENHLGWVIFPFVNNCSENTSVSLCVKSWPAGSSEPTYNSYYGVVSGLGRMDISDGMWRSYDSYRWQEKAPQMCPFE